MELWFRCGLIACPFNYIRLGMLSKKASLIGQMTLKCYKSHSCKPISAFPFCLILGNIWLYELFGSLFLKLTKRGHGDIWWYLSLGVYVWQTWIKFGRNEMCFGILFQNNMRLLGPEYLRDSCIKLLHRSPSSWCDERRHNIRTSMTAAPFQCSFHSYLRSGRAGLGG